MKKSLRLIVVELLAIGAIIVSQNTFAASNAKLEDFKVVNKTNVDFSFMGICGKGVVVKGNPDIKQQGQFIYKIGGQDATGEIGYFDNTHHEVINFDYDYTKPGGYVSAQGGAKYYQFNEYCTLNGNEIVITNKQ